MADRLDDVRCPRRRRSAMLSPVMVGLLLAASGCGGDDPPAPVATVTVTASPSSAPSPTTPGESAVPSDAGSSSAATAPTSYDEALALVATGEDVGELNRFVTPGGQVYCALNVLDMPAACELSTGAVADSSACPGAGPVAAVGRIEFDAGVATAICNSDTIRTTGAPVLDYGSVATTRDTQCLVERDGVTCVARNGNGAFFLRPGAYTLLNP